MFIRKIPDPIDLSEFAAKVRASSNFRFAWQFHEVDDFGSSGERACQRLLDVIVFDADLHEFLSSSLDNYVPRKFKIRPLHGHCEIREGTGEFINTMARAAFDHLGAYSRELIDATPEQREYTRKSFSRLGHFTAYSIFPGTKADCSVCQQHDQHLFSNWFHGVAWDFTYFVLYPTRNIIWIGCLTDTD